MSLLVYKGHVRKCLLEGDMNLQWLRFAQIRCHWKISEAKCSLSLLRRSASALLAMTTSKRNTNKSHEWLSTVAQQCAFSHFNITGSSNRLNKAIRRFHVESLCFLLKHLWTTSQQERQRGSLGGKQVL